MSNPFTETWPPVRRLFLAGYLVTTTMALACGPRAAIAADMPLKAPEAPAYRWSGCYVGMNLGGGASGTNFTSTVDPGTHLQGATPRWSRPTAAAAQMPTAVLAGGQAGCNWQSGTFVEGLEGDFDYFHSNPKFSNNTNTLATAHSFTISQSLTTDFLATVRPRIGIAADRNLAYITGGAAFTRISYTEGYVRRERSARRRHRDRFQILRGLDCRRRLGICLRGPIGRCEPNIFMPASRRPVRLAQSPEPVEPIRSTVPRISLSSWSAPA